MKFGRADSLRDRAYELLIIRGRQFESSTTNTMITTYLDSAFAVDSLGLSELKNTVLEVALIGGAGLFWIAALPFVALSLMLVKIWDTVKAVASGAPVRPNPLILRRGLVRNGLTLRSRRTAGI